MDYDQITTESYYHKNLVAITAGIVIVVFLVIMGIYQYNKLMIDSGYVYEYGTKSETPSGWVYKGEKK